MFDRAPYGEARKGADATARPVAIAPRPDARGSGVVIFDLETTELIEEDVAIEDMTASVACAMWLPAASTVDASIAGADTRTFWHESVTRAPNGEAAVGMRGLLEWFDGAAMIVAYNGREFDMRVLKGCYRADEEDLAFRTLIPEGADCVPTLAT